MNKSNKKSQAFKIFKLSNLSKKLLTLLTITILSITTGACVDKKADNQDPAPTPAPTPVPTNQLDVLAIDKEKAFFVTPTGTENKDCTTWKNACDLQTAIDKANADANKKFVLVAQGTYFADPAKTNETKTFILKTGVKIYGGFDVSAEELKRYAQASILEGKLSNTLNTKQILKGENLTDATILDGFLIQNAAGVGHGGALYLNNSNPKLTNLVFKNNNTNSGGGAIYNDNNSSPSVSNSTFIGNSAYAGGGAISNYNSSPSISNSTFSGNHAFGGGAISNYYSSNPSISNSVFIGNSVENNGGAILNYKSSPSISNSILWNNKDKHKGGESINNIYNNDRSSKPTIKNSILNANSAVTMQSGQNDSSKTDPYNFMDFIKAEFKDNQNPETFDIESDGKITDTASQELIKDKGDNALYLNVYDLIHGTSETSEIPTDDKDLAGKPRLNGASIDIGAYELQD